MTGLLILADGTGWLRGVLLIAAGWGMIALFYRIRRHYLWRRLQRLEQPDSELIPSDVFNTVGGMMASVAAKIGTRTSTAEATAMVEVSKQQLGKLIDLDAPFARIGRELLLQGVLRLVGLFHAKLGDRECPTGGKAYTKTESNR